MGQVVHRQQHGDVKHLAGEHVDVLGDDSLRDGLVQHAHCRAAVGVESTLRLPRGAARVEDEKRIGVGGFDRVIGLIATFDQALVRAIAAAVLEPMFDVDVPPELGGLGLELAREHDRPRAPVLDDPRHLGHAETPVERLRDQTAAAGGKVDLEKLDAVLGQDRDPVARREPQGVAKGVSEPPNPSVELGERDAATTGRIDHGLASRRQPRPLRRDGSGRSSSVRPVEGEEPGLEAPALALPAHLVSVHPRR